MRFRPFAFFASSLFNGLAVFTTEGEAVSVFFHAFSDVLHVCIKKYNPRVPQLQQPVWKSFADRVRSTISAHFLISLSSSPFARTVVFTLIQLIFEAIFPV